MVFTSTVFLFLFLPLVMLVYYNPIFKSRGFKNKFLLLASLFFYAWGEPIYVFLMIFSIFVTWLTGLTMAKPGGYRRTLCIIGIGWNVGLLIVFKYSGFLLGEINRFAQFENVPLIDIKLPIGISFFTFQMMSYIFDVYYEKVEVQKSLLNVGLYVTLFPQLIAGPIVRYETIEYQIEHRKESYKDFSEGIERFVVGLVKKALIADYIGEIANKIFLANEITDLGAITAWVGAIAYTLEIYFDFSGYSDMAIGLGRCFGFHFKENFTYPYTARSITGFWRKWHISLTDWFRDYVYIPLGGNRVNKRRHMLNLFIVWMLTGIWHGANYTFILWGMIYFVLQLIEKYVLKGTDKRYVIGHLYTMVIVTILWTLFKSDSVSSFLKMFKSMLGCNGVTDINSIAYLKNSLALIIIGLLGSVPFVKWINERFIKQKDGMSKSVCLTTKYVCLLLILAAVSFKSISGGYSPFIYFNF